MTKGAVAAKNPIAIDVEAGESYYWCSCGQSSNQPFCDGSHKGSEFAPIVWEAKEAETKYFCACKQTEGQPFCDGSHNALDADVSGCKIEQRDDGPLVVKGEVVLEDYKGNRIKTKPVTALCRCGKSGNKPFCDGSHKDAGYSSACETESRDGRVFSYESEEVTVHFNKLLCSHAGECGRLNSDVFDVKQRPWVQPEKGSIQSIREVIAACPSGALTISDTGGDARQIANDTVKIRVERNGPYWVQNIKTDGAEFSNTASKQKYVLCRCGLSKNKPFCDGTHYDEKWRD